VCDVTSEQAGNNMLTSSRVGGCSSNHVCIYARETCAGFTSRTVCLAHRLRHSRSNIHSDTHTAPPHARKVALPLPSTTQKTIHGSVAIHTQLALTPQMANTHLSLMLLAGLATPSACDGA
jgi:hypothetical protein